MAHQFPGIRTSTDGSNAVVWVETLAASGAAAYPITPATNMGVGFQQSVADGAKNAWGESLVFFEPESEHSAASVCEGFALAGGRVSNFTAGQGLVLMKEVLFTIAGKRLPMVFNIGARALTVQALNVHGGHDDVMAVADSGWGMLFARNVQEAGDFCLISRRTSEDSMVPYFNIQDGFLTTHTLETALLPEAELIKTYLKSPAEAMNNLMDPKRPVMTGTVQNQDAYMRGKVAQRSYYDPLLANLKANMQRFGELTGRKYEPIDQYRMQDAEFAIVGMGTFMETACSTVDWLREHKGIKVGVVSVLSYRPFPAEDIVAALAHVKVISVLERLDESSAPENPLARDIKAAFSDAAWGRSGFVKIDRTPIIQHGAGGLGGRDVRSCHIEAIVKNMQKGAEGKIRYCVGINHPAELAHSEAEPDIRPPGTFCLRGHSIGGYGSVTTNKIIASVCNDFFNLNVQAFPKYGAEKKGLPTQYFLSASPDKIRYHQELQNVDMVFLNDTHAFSNGDPLAGLTPGGGLLVQGNLEAATAVFSHLPAATKERIRNLKAKLFYIDAAQIARDKTTRTDLVQRMQGIVLLGSFLRLTPFAERQNLDRDHLLTEIVDIIRKYFGKRGEKVVEENMQCVRRGFDEVREVPAGVLS